MLSLLAASSMSFVILGTQHDDKGLPIGSCRLFQFFLPFRFFHHEPDESFLVFGDGHLGKPVADRVGRHEAFRRKIIAGNVLLFQPSLDLHFEFVLILTHAPFVTKMVLFFNLFCIKSF